MTNSVGNAVNLAAALQNYNTMQQKDAILLRNTLDNQVNTVARLVNSLPSIPKLATAGTVGTYLHTTA